MFRFFKQIIDKLKNGCCFYFSILTNCKRDLLLINRWPTKLFDRQLYQPPRILYAFLSPLLSCTLIDETLRKQFLRLNRFFLHQHSTSTRSLKINIAHICHSKNIEMLFNLQLSTVNMKPNEIETRPKGFFLIMGAGMYKWTQ